MTKAARRRTLCIGGSQSGYIGRKMYVANIKHDAATQTGHMITKFIHNAKYAGKSPKALLIYTYSPPDSGKAAPSSA